MTFVIRVVIVISAPGVTSVAVSDRVIMIPLLGVGVAVAVTVAVVGAISMLVLFVYSPSCASLSDSDYFE